MRAYLPALLLLLAAIGGGAASAHSGGVVRVATMQAGAGQLR